MTLPAEAPFSGTVNGSPNATRANFLGEPSANPGQLDQLHPGNDSERRPTGPFTIPASTGGVFNAPGTFGRDILIGLGSSNIDMSIFKTLQVWERIGAKFRDHAYNLTNTLHFANPNSNLSVIGNSQFGYITSTIPIPYRQSGLGLRVTP